MKHVVRRWATLIATLFIYSALMAQTAATSKMSVLVRRALTEQQTAARRAPGVAHRQLTAFVQTADGSTDALTDEGCRVLSSFGNIHVVSIPLARLGALSMSERVLRIEAGERCSVTMDTTATVLHAQPVYAGEQLPQAYTGRGVVMGIQDIGFDLTHPNFYSRDLTQYRIKAFWDQLSTDTIGSTLYVGRDYTTRDELLTLGHSRDGLDQTHGTHTLGIAAGSGYTSNYRGMAYESDICLVANAVSDDREYIADADLYKYTTATDVLGFQYIFDYAKRNNQPCVISFSEGYHPDFYGEDQLYYAVLDSLTGPGRILVASAGNEGIYNSYFMKPKGMESTGGFVLNSDDYVAWLMRSTDFFDVRLVVYQQGKNDTIVVPSRWAYEAADSQYVDTLRLSTGDDLVITMAGYPSCYDVQEQAYEMVVQTPDKSLGIATKISVELVGREAEVEWFRYAGYLTTDARNPSLNAGEPSHNIHSPGAAPAVICVGANSYRTGVVNYLGEYRPYDQGTKGRLGDYSSTGPTLDGRVKPDVVAPGTNVISSYSSYYLENHPDANDIKSDVEHFSYNDRTYVWNANSGTSMSSPAVGGAIALWLEANPRLTPDDCKDIFAKTCEHYDESLTYPNNQYGYGEIDVYNGLLEALDLAANIPSLSRHQPSAVLFSLRNDVLTIAGASKKPSTVRIYTTDGRQVFSQRFAACDGEIAITLDALPRGVLVVQVDGASAATTGSTLIRH